MVAAVGDSLTDRRAPGEQYPEILAKMCPESRFDNHGKGGDMVNQMRRRLLRDVLTNGVAYSHVIVFGGVNDLYSDETAGRTPALIEGDLTTMYEAIKKAGAEVVALSIAPWGGFKRWYNPSRARAMKEVNAWILAGVNEGRAKHAIDTVPLLSCGDPERLCETVTHKPFVDGLHFDEEGQKKVAAALHARVFADCK